MDSNQPARFAQPKGLNSPCQKLVSEEVKNLLSFVRKTVENIDLTALLRYPDLIAVPRFPRPKVPQ